MIPALLATVVYGFGSAFIPAIPAEPYVIGLMATTALPAVPVGVAVAIGQTAGKVLIFLAVRGLIRAPWLQRWIAKRMPWLNGREARVPVPRAGRALAVPAPRQDGTAVVGAVLPAELAGTVGSGPAGTVGSGPAGTVGSGPAGTDETGGADEPDESDGGKPTRRRAFLRVLKAGMAKLVALLDRPVLQAPIVLLSAAVGLPPLLLVSAYAARTQMTTGLFAAVCLLGRSIRFVAIAYTPGLVMD